MSDTRSIGLIPEMEDNRDPEVDNMEQSAASANVEEESPWELMNRQLTTEELDRTWIYIFPASTAPVDTYEYHYYDIKQLRMGMLIRAWNPAEHLQSRGPDELPFNLKHRNFVIIKIFSTTIVCLPILTEKDDRFDPADDKDYIPIRNEEEKDAINDHGTDEEKGSLWVRTFPRVIADKVAHLFAMNEHTKLHLFRVVTFTPEENKISVFGYLDLESRQLLRRLYWGF